MESKMSTFCTVVALLGILAAAVGFAAEATRVQESDVYIVENTCYYPSSPAFAFGIIAALLTIATRVYISVTFGGCSCFRSDPNSTLASKLVYILSWVASVIGVAILLAAAGLNNKEGEEVDSYGYLTCYVVKPGIFAVGAVLSLLSAIFGIVAYVMLTSTPQTITNSMVAFPVDADADLEKSPKYPQ
ncbi:hypothetical protein OSB04_010000 [Centaurea solstitialis]|uniref:Uncharacterized protein n=1 Tax=Centaurea solstitialis TaxID=347529 RepID=A0AA38THJ0_9ASTR|nr:hypothetical protein OSB04_010000 [Centaurea solstitialis]